MTTAWRARFFAPRHAICDSDIERWQSSGAAETPGADAWCRIWLLAAPAGRAQAAFAAYGPPVVIAAADWLCEQISSDHIDTAAGITSRAVEQALSLAPEQRYAGLLVIDALANALSDLGR